MPYKFATERPDYSDLASGRVFRSLPGHPAFPVRLASEVFQRCVALCAENGVAAPYVLYDPCCGAAYHLSVLAYFHRDQIAEVIGSDIDEKAAAMARQNLGLLNLAGLDERIARIETLLSQHGKPAHQEALASARSLRAQIEDQKTLVARVFQANALDGAALRTGLKGKSVDIIFTDVPYGQHSEWQEAGADPLRSMLDALFDLLLPGGVVAVASAKGQKISHEKYRRLEYFQVGKRRVAILKPIR